MELFYIFTGISILGIIAYALQIWAVRSTLKKNDVTIPQHPTIPYPPISILKPLKGLDDNLFDNLASFCEQDYPEYEIIFSLQDHNDPAYKLAQKIKDRYPKRDISIIVERCDIGLNPKVNNIIPAYKASKYDLILISDSNVMVDKDYLRQIVRPMDDLNVSLVSNLISGVGGRTMGSRLENLHLNSFIIGSVCFLDKFLSMPCVIGKSMLMRKSDLEAIGGFQTVKDVLAEDYIIGKKMHKRGKKVILSNHIIKNVNEYWSIKKFINRHTRWGRLRWKIGGIRYISELISNPVFMSFILLLLWEVSRMTVYFLLFVSLLKIIGDYYLGKMIGSCIRGQGSTDRREEKYLDPLSLTFGPLYYLLSPVKDIIIGLIWFVPILSNTVVWRGNRYVIGKDSVLSPYPESRIWAWRYRIVDTIKARFA